MTYLDAFLNDLGIPNTFLAGAIYMAVLTAVLYWGFLAVHLLSRTGESRRERMRRRLRGYRHR